MLGLRLAITVLVCVAAACSRGRTYDLRGQVLAVDPSRQELTVKHQDIEGFMPGMTMPFKVRGSAVADRQPGDLIRATLVVEESQAYLTNVTATGHAPVTERPAARTAADLLESGEEVPDASFVDQRGAARPLRAWRGRVLVVTFTYTRCPLPDFCPLIDRRFQALQQTIRARPGLADRVHLLSVSFDPRFDTPAVLDAHARRAGADPTMWTFVTGEPDAIDTFASRFGVSILREEASGAEIVHNLRTAIVDPRGRLARIVNGTDWSPDDLADMVENLSAVR